MAMPILKTLLEGVEYDLVQGIPDVNISAIQFDSRKVEEGTFFVAIKGTQVDGHHYITSAIQKGAIAVLCEDLPESLQEGVTYIKTPHSSRALGLVAANFYGNPSRELQVVGVTGTNGKTSSVTLLFRLFRRMGYHVGLLSTVQNQINEEIIPTEYTTPDAIAIQALFSEMLRKGCTYCFMEVSSHALVQERTSGIEFTGSHFYQYQ